jgi:hypothetical protein
MSYHLAARYSRPDSSVMINVDHSSCLALAGTFEPCYILTLSALPSQMQATTNKRNAALIQSFMADILSVPPERGIIKFTPVPEENYAFNGNTLYGEIERLEQQQTNSNGAKRSVTDNRKSMPAMPAFSSKRSTSEIDIDFAKKVDQANGFDGHVEELRNGAHVPDVFRLAGYKNNDERPSTSNGTPSNSSFAALNGLRLNGITKEDLEGPDTRTSFGRPKTVSGGPVWSSSENFDLTPRRGSDEGAPAPTVKSEPRQHSKDLRKSPLPDFKTSSRSSTPVQKQIPTPVLTSPTGKSKTPTITSTTERPKTSTMTSTTEKTKPAYLENPPKSALAKSHSRSKSKSQSPPEALPQDDGTAANTAKRRSTVNGSSSTSKVPPPPPVPVSKEAKVSKRKSFLSAFRR